MRFDISNFKKADHYSSHAIKRDAFDSIPTNFSVYEIMANIQHSYLHHDIMDGFPDKYSVKDDGVWIYINTLMKKIYSSSQIYQIFLEWAVDDINNNYLVNYYDLLRGYCSFIEFCDYKIKQADFVDFEGVELSNYEWCLYSLVVYPTYWQDDFKSNPIHWTWTNDLTEDTGFPIQAASDPFHRAYFTQEFIVEIFTKYCPNWHYSEQKSKKKVVVFTKPCHCSDEYEWCIVAQVPKFYKANFQVVLSKRNNKKLNSKDIIFQCKFFIPFFDRFLNVDLLSAWKANTIFKYHYVERYIDYIEPLIFDNM